MNHGTVAEKLQTSLSFIKKHLSETVIYVSATVILSQAAWAYWTVIKL